MELAVAESMTKVRETEVDADELAGATLEAGTGEADDAMTIETDDDARAVDDATGVELVSELITKIPVEEGVAAGATVDETWVCAVFDAEDEAIVEGVALRPGASADDDAWTTDVDGDATMLLAGGAAAEDDTEVTTGEGDTVVILKV